MYFLNYFITRQISMLDEVANVGIGIRIVSAKSSVKSRSDAKSCELGQS